MNIYIIGTGVMGGAIAKAFAAKGQKVFVYNKTFKKASGLAKSPNIIAVKNLDNLTKADYIFLAVKPYQLADLSVQTKFPQQAILVSIAAGVKISTIQTLFSHRKVVRLMPNLGLSVGLGIAGWKSLDLSSKEKAGAKKVLDNLCENFEVEKEAQIDAVTAVSGSGPAYFFYFASALEHAALALGFNKHQARKLTEKTFLAAAILQQDADYEQLVQRVASKRGTTEQALKVLKTKNLNKIILEAVRAAQKRAKEISNE